MVLPVSILECHMPITILGVSGEKSKCKSEYPVKSLEPLTGLIRKVKVRIKKMNGRGERVLPAFSLDVHSPRARESALSHMGQWSSSRAAESHTAQVSQGRSDSEMNFSKQSCLLGIIHPDSSAIPTKNVVLHNPPFDCLIFNCVTIWVRIRSQFSKTPNYIHVYF
jgi:hypothetical protein